MKKRLIIVGLVVGFFLVGVVAMANAVTFTYEYSFDGTSWTEELSAAGNQLNVGDIVTASFSVQGAGYWSVTAGADVWTPIYIADPGTRTGDLDWDFELDGTVVESGTSLGLSSAMVHIPQWIDVVTTFNFDWLIWSYEMTATTSTLNTLGNILTFVPFDYEVTYIAGTLVPEPVSLLLIGVGIIGLAGIRVRRKI